MTGQRKKVIRDLALVHHNSSSVTMETGKPGLASAPVHINAVAAQTDKSMDVQAPLTAVYIHTLPALPAQPYPQLPAAAREPATLHLAMPPLYSKETLPFLTLHIAGGLHSQPGLNLAAASPATKPKSAGKHVCPHCGRDCMKPSVLEKHLRCHTGERPYPCTTCGISFKTQSNLYKHKRTQAHARLSSESEQSSLGSLDSMSSSRETFTSSLSLDDHCGESNSIEKDATVPNSEINSPANTSNTCSARTQGSVNDQNEWTTTDQKTKELNEGAKVTLEGEKQRMESERPLTTVSISRHLPLKRQEATLSSKQWKSSVSRGKSQNHESTDSGFSESSDHYPSPSSMLHDHSMDSLTESTKEHLEETTSTKTVSQPGQSGQEPKDTAREQEQKTLEERISKLISQNTAVVEDKQLENVRPRKTVLSKQGSIDLPVPYTYKDSFHFDMKISKANVGLQRNRKPGLYSSVPTQHSTTVEHAPLTRSNSLPFSVTLLQPERNTPTSSYQGDYVTLVRRGSSGQINPTGFAIRPVNQQSSTHRPLVRQTAVDCNHATDGLFMNLSVEEACSGSLSCDGDSGDICGEPSNRKFRRKKTQKFAYNKWYMYGGGTFKKLYSAEKGGDDCGIKGKKCLTNPENEVAQGLQNKLAAVHKETEATTGTQRTNITSSSGKACHPDCPSVQLSHVTAVDFNLKTSQPQTPCSSLKSPLRRNLSSSILPLPLIGSLVSHKTDSMIRAKDRGLNNDEKHSESSSQPCGAHVPSDRKKQKTDDKMICPLQMETDQNTVTHPPPSVTGSAPQHDTNLSYINLQKNQKQSQLKGTFFPPCINANTPSVSTLPITPVPAAAKTSFLPKYQLKLPNAAELDSNPLPDVVDEPTAIDGHSFTSALVSSHTEQTPLCVTTSEKRCSHPGTSLLMHSCDDKKANVFISTQSQVLLPWTATTLCEVATSSLNTNATSSLATVHRQFAATTKTTTSLRDCQAGLCSTSIQLSKSAGVAGSVQPTAPMVASFAATPTMTTANNPTPAVAITPVSHSKPNPNPPLPRAQVSPVLDESSPGNRAFVGSDTPVLPCHIVPFDQMQPAAQNVFHVHTADLQICLQIISDEQLALIEPQIERHSSSILSQRQEMTAEAPEASRSTTQSSVTANSEKKGHQQPGHHTELDKSESLPTKGIKIPPAVEFGTAVPNPHLTEHSNSTEAMVSAGSRPPKTLSLSQHPHKYSHVNKVTETQSTVGDVMSTAASLRGVKFGRSETLEEEHTPPLNLCAEERLLLDRRVSQGGLVSQTPASQHKLSMTSLSPSAASHNNLGRKILGNKSQHKPKNQGPMCNAGIIEAKDETSTYKGSRTESEGTHPTLQAGLSQASSAQSVEKLSGLVPSFSINRKNRYKTPRQLNSQASIYCSHPLESTLSKAPNSPQQENMGGDRMNEITLNKSQVRISSAHSEKQLGQFTSMPSNMQVENPKDLPAVLTSIQDPTAGHIERDSIAGCAGGKEPVTEGHRKSPGQADGTEWRPKQRHEAKETETNQGMEGQAGGGGGDDKTHEEPSGQCDKTESNCKYICLQHMAKPEGEDRQAKADSSKNSWLSEQHLLHLSQTLSGMSEYSQQSPQQVPGTSNDLNLPTSSSQTCLCDSPHSPLETNNFSFSQQHWESSVLHNQQTQISCESNSSQHVKAPTQSESGLQQTFSHQDQKQTTILSSIQEGDEGAGYTQTTLGAHKSMLHDLKSSHSSHSSQLSHSVHVSRAAGALTVDTQPSTDNVPEDNLELPSKSFNYPESENDHNTKDKAAHDYLGLSSNPARPDLTDNKYQPFFFAGQLHGCQQSDCLPTGVRPVQNCQDYTEDTSSSDDEGKLIIEL